MKLLIATTNPGKIREFREMLGGGRFEWDDLSAHRGLAAPDETGLTFRANAMFKAAHYAKELATWALADDSGLEVDALGGKPGVHSARWAILNSGGAGDAANNATLLAQLHEKTLPGEWPIFTARFSCVLALSDPAGRIALTTMASVEGRMISQARGSNGFGYDPLFFIDALGKTTAELPPEKKHEISHRGKALRRMRTLIDAHLTGDQARLTVQSPVKETS